MSEKQHPVTPTATTKAGEFMPGSHRRISSTRMLRNVLIGVVIALVLICIEGILWIVNPGHVFGGGTPQSLSTLLAIPAHAPLLLLVPLIELIAACAVVLAADKPLAMRAYTREVQRATERYRRLYTPIAAWSAIYDTTITYYQDTPDPARAQAPRTLSIPELAQQGDTHQVVLGQEGAGKTTALLYIYQYMIMQRSMARGRGRDKIPIYIPLEDYGLFLKALQEAAPNDVVSDGTLLDFLYTGDLPGLHHLRPHLQKLIAQGGIVLLCDGLDEVDDSYQEAVAAELAQWLGQNQNYLIIASQQAQYRRQPQLVQAASENLAARAIIHPLEQAQMRNFIEQYIEGHAADNQRRHTAGQIMDVINRSRLRDHYTNPMLLFILLEIVDTLGAERAKRLDTRSRLLRAFVSHLIQQAKRQPRWNQDAPPEIELVLLLGEIACAARWEHCSNAIQLPISRTGEGGARSRHSIEELAASLQSWLDEHRAQVPLLQENVRAPYSRPAGTPISRPPLNQSSEAVSHKASIHAELVRQLQFAQSATLIDFSPDGILSFRHEMLASYLAAEYLLGVGALGGTKRSASQARTPQGTGSAANDGLLEFMLSGIEHWSEPVAMWAGLLDDPVEAAQRLVAYGRTEVVAQPTVPEDGGAAPVVATIPGVADPAREGAAPREPDPPRIPVPPRVPARGTPTMNGEVVAEADGVMIGNIVDTLTVSLICVGAAWTPPQVENPRQVAAPPAVEEAMGFAVHNAEARTTLVRIVTRCAEEGAPEIYQSIFPLLMIDGIDEFVVLLDPVVVPELLFKQLCAVVDDAAYDLQVKRLVRVLGRFGAAALPGAAELARPVAGRSVRLRSAAVNILGGTGVQGAVGPLIACLGDKDQFIFGRAANALLRLGPEYTLPSVIQELEEHTPSATRQQIHEAALRILERFLDEPGPARQLTPVQHQRIINALMQILSANYAPQVQQRAREMLVRQGRTAEKSESGEKAVTLLIQNLSSPDEMIVRSALKTLREIGAAATPRLLGLLKAQPPESIRGNVVEVLGQVRDPRALPYLLPLLADPALTVQQQAAAALRAYAPESIPGLIDVVLHSESESVAARAEQVLGDLGEGVVKPVIAALFPVVAGRTNLLVHVLERLRDPQAIAALITLLATADSEQTLVLAVIHTLGEFPDERVVSPLLGMLANPNPLLYEAAINALSHLGEVALGELVVALDVEQKTDGTSRVQRALLGMADFPGERLLDVLAQASDALAQQIIDIFLAKGAEAAQVLVVNLFHPNRRVQNCVRLMVGEMNGRVIVPALIEELDRPEASWHAVIAGYLLRHPQEAIPPLVGLLDDPERGDAAERILLDFGQEVLPSLVPGLDALNNLAQEHTQRIIVELVRQMPEVLTDVVQLFNLSLPQRAHETLVGVLANELADVSVPALLEGLEDAHLVGDASQVLVYMVNKDDARSDMVLSALLDALRIEKRRHGAMLTLEDIGAKAVPGVGSLITDPDPSIAQAAQNTLCQMGVPAFSFIWAAHSDGRNPARRDAARGIFRKMPTVVIKDELVQLLMGDEPETISMALALLLERIHDESLRPGHEHEMIPALLEQVQTHGDERASLRILALLLLLGGNMVVHHMTQVLYDSPDHQEQLIQAFLLLGKDAEEKLIEILHDSDAPAALRAEAAGVLGMLVPYQDIREYARMPGEYGLWAGRSIKRTGVLQPERLAISLRALGGLLAGGHWNIAELQELRSRSPKDSAERELYEILLGWRYTPSITMLENDLETEREEHKKEIWNYTQQILTMRSQMMDLEHALEQIQQEHSTRGEELEQASQELDDMRQSLDNALQDKHALQDNLQHTMQEKQALRASVQQLTQENERLQSRDDQWKTYCEGLEEQLGQGRGTRKKK